MLRKLLCATLLAGVAALVWQSLPDLRRYLRLSRM
ncbi:DUF6893 family small protein [Kitasatospora sp. NPDC087314]|nr:hypothetical protein [Kitasatospora sp. MAA19]